MRSHKIVFVLIILFASFQISFGQEIPKAELVDDLGEANCESYWSRFDAFFALLQNNPASTGYIIIYGEKNSVQKNLGYEKLTDGIISFRNLDHNRLVVIHGKEESQIHIQFWKVPAGAESPTYIKGNWDLKIKQSKPFILQGYLEDDICPTSTSVKLFAEYLAANPTFRANIIITEKTTESFANTKKGIINRLINNHNISPNRLKFFYVKNKNFADGFNHVEFWLFLRKKR